MKPTRNRENDMSKTIQFECDPGAPLLGAKSPVVEVIDVGTDTYLWIGNNAAKNQWCYATLTDRATLRRLAKAIMKATK